MRHIYFLFVNTVHLVSLIVKLKPFHFRGEGGNSGLLIIY